MFFDTSSTFLPDVDLHAQLIGKIVANTSARETPVAQETSHPRSSLRSARQFTTSIRGQTAQGKRAWTVHGRCRKSAW